MNGKILCKAVRLNSLGHCSSVSLNTQKLEQKSLTSATERVSGTLETSLPLSLCQIPNNHNYCGSYSHRTFSYHLSFKNNFIVEVKKNKTKTWSYVQERNADCFTAQFLLTALNCIREFPLPNTRDKHCISSSSKK